MHTKNLITLITLVISAPLFGAQQSVKFRPISPVAFDASAINYDTVVVQKSPDVLEMLHKKRQSPTDFSNPNCTASPLLRQLCYEAISNVQGHCKKYPLNPAQVFVVASAKTAASRRFYTHETILTSGKKLSKEHFIPHLKINANQFMQNGGYGALRMAIHHEAAHLVLGHGPSEFTIELIADEVAAKSGGCKSCCISAAYRHWHPAPGFEKYTFEAIQKMSNEELQKHISALDSLSTRPPEGFSHPANLDRCFRFINLSRSINSLCSYHEQQMKSGQPTFPGPKKRSVHPETSLRENVESPTKKLKVDKPDQNPMETADDV